MDKERKKSKRAKRKGQRSKVMPFGIEKSYSRNVNAIKLLATALFCTYFGNNTTLALLNMNFPTTLPTKTKR